MDFGKAGLGVRGVVDRGRRPAVTPAPRHGARQAFWGETSECVCQGLRTVFEFAGGVPPAGRSTTTPPRSVGASGARTGPRTSSDASLTVLTLTPSRTRPHMTNGLS